MDTFQLPFPIRFHADNGTGCVVAQAAYGTLTNRCPPQQRQGSPLPPMRLGPPQLPPPAPPPPPAKRKVICVVASVLLHHARNFGQHRCGTTAALKPAQLPT